MTERKRFDVYHIHITHTSEIRSVITFNKYNLESRLLQVCLVERGDHTVLIFVYDNGFLHHKWVGSRKFEKRHEC